MRVNWDGKSVGGKSSPYHGVWLAVNNNVPTLTEWHYAHRFDIPHASIDLRVLIILHIRALAEESKSRENQSKRKEAPANNYLRHAKITKIPYIYLCLIALPGQVYAAFCRT